MVKFAISGEVFAWPEPLFRPILFLYRHYLELMLKYWNQKLAKEPARTWHDLSKSWNALKPRIVEVYFETGAEQESFRKTLQEVEEVVLAFHRYDENSQESRYLEMHDKNGEGKRLRTTLDNVPQVIDVVTELKDRISQVDGFFEGFSEITGR